MILPRLLRVLLLLCSASAAQATELLSTPVENEITTATLIASSNVLVRDKTLWIGLHLDMPDDWHTYWINPGDTGLAAKVTPNLPVGVTLGPIHWPVPERVETAGLINFGYHDEVLLLMPLTLDPNVESDAVEVTLKADWLVCKDICIPESANLSLTLPVADAGEATLSPRFARAVAGLPAPLAGARYHVQGDEVLLQLPFADAGVTFYPETETMVSFTNLPQISVQDAQTFLTFERGVQPDNKGFSGIAVRTNGMAVHIDATPDTSLAAITEEKESENETAPVKETAEIVVEEAPRETPLPAPTQEDVTLPLAFLLAFLGGLVLNAMPCVLPVLSLKVLGLVKKAHISRRAAAIQGLAYTGGVLISFLAVAGTLIALQQSGASLGWGYQLQSPVFVLGLTAVMFAVGLNLSGVFTVPGMLGNLGHRAAAQETVLGSFLTGALATLVATPCTAPFMASAIGFALTLSPLGALSIFFMLGLGLAFPYLMISLFPSLRRWLPRPGYWMETFRQFLAFPMYATAAWLLWVLSTQSGPDVLAIGLALLLVIALAAWASTRADTRPSKLIILITLIALGSWMLSEVAQSQKPATREAYSEDAFSEARLDALVAQGVPVFVNATANWCITCKVNERIALSSETVKEHFRTQGITVLVADWTSRDPAISAYLAKFGRSGVPTYVFYPPAGEPVLLPQLLTPETVINATRD